MYLKIWRYLLAIVVLCGVALAVYVAHLDRIVTTQFEGRRWTLPAQVYAAPLELYAGEDLSAPDLEHELQRLQYRRAEHADQPGSYARQGDRFQISLRAARFADEMRPATVLNVASSGAGIVRLTDLTGKEVAIARFEPLLIGSIGGTCSGVTTMRSSPWIGKMLPMSSGSKRAMATSLPVRSVSPTMPAPFEATLSKAAGRISSAKRAARRLIWNRSPWRT